MSDIEYKTVYENADSWYTGKLEDKDGDPITQSNVATLTLTLYEKKTGTIINSRNDSDITGSGSWGGNATISDAGLITLRLEPADNAIVSGNYRGKGEVHVIYLKGTTSGVPSYTFVTEFEYEVINNLKAT